MKRIIVQFVNDMDFIITYQSNKQNFGGGRNGQYFYTENFSLVSASRPQADTARCYVQGEYEEGDYKIVRCLNKIWKKKFLDAVNKYNEYFSKDEKR